VVAATDHRPLTPTELGLEAKIGLSEVRPRGDLLVGTALLQQRQDLLLSRGEAASCDLLGLLLHLLRGPVQKIRGHAR